MIFFCCCGTIEISTVLVLLVVVVVVEYPLRVEMLFGIQPKAAATASAFLSQHFSTSEVILQQTQIACFISILQQTC